MSSPKTSSSPPRTRQGKLWLGPSAVLGASEAKLADFGLALYVGGNFFSEPPSAQFASAVMLTSSEAPLHAGIGQCSGKTWPVQWKSAAVCQVPPHRRPTTPCLLQAPPGQASSLFLQFFWWRGFEVRPFLQVSCS